MSEEKKGSKDVKKMVYEVPRLVKISGVTAKGDCLNGSGDTANCDIGNAAINSCPQGNVVVSVTG